jgi:hypothetical protein
LTTTICRRTFSMPLLISQPRSGTGMTRPGPSDYGVIVVCSSMTLVASINAPI